MKYFLFLMPLLILSCTSRETGSVSEASDTALIISDTTSQVSSLETFTDLPPAIEGCSGLFTHVNEKAKDRYVLAMDLQGKAYIKINGKLVELTRTHKENKDSAIIESYKVNNVELTLNLLESERAGDELWIYSGELNLNLDGVSEILNIKGEVGC